MIRIYKGVEPTLAQGAWVDPQASVIGDVVLGEDVSVWPFAAVRGDVNKIRIGARTNVQDNSVLHVTHDGPYTPGGVPLVIGEDVTIGHGVILHACTIHDRALLGMGCIVMDKVEIQDDVYVAAGALVTPGKVLESGWLYSGQPARQKRKLSQDELDNFRYSAAHYVRIKNNYLDSSD